ncbi:MULTISPECIES: phospholipid scramblase-related protein [Thermomonospora]|uniref:Scramblase n=1 Tax=Thermomonospora cellulosilytica TaxID=1411118 RepID=A0A7W3R8H5_9ACTN|nr:MULTISPECIES: phospholipid scramblase-related protein [Thermomonospora]MBA9003345.1 hypothetical protein [Thermomonospora cellulosilytica]
MTELFTLPTLRVEQPRKVVATRTRYNFLDERGTLVAVATDTNERSRRVAVRAALPGNVLAGAQTLLLTDPDEVPLLVIEKQASNRRTVVRRPGDDSSEESDLFEGEVVGTIEAVRTTRHYVLRDAEGAKLGEVTGDLSLKRFAVTDTESRHVAQVNKRWAGLRAELLTNADRYSVEFLTNRLSEPLRALVVVLATVLDLTLHESKDIV